MEIFVTGATGYIGGAVAAELAAAGHAVTGLVRTPEKAARLASLGIRAVAGDLKDPASYQEVAAEHEVLLHAGYELSRAGVATDRTALEILLAAAQSGRVRQLIYTSCLWVLGATGDTPADEDTPLGEPPALVAWRPEHERLALVGAGAGAGADLVTAVIRPGLVYGGSGGLTAPYFASAVEHGAARYVGDGTNRVNPIHLADLARLYRAVVKSRAGGVFHGVDGRPLRLAELAQAASAAAGRGGATESIPLEEARRRMGPYADALALDQVAQSRRGPEIGWEPRHAGFVADAGEAFRDWQAARG
jgi:nucleoside-diphosphate-sugar epimerase